MDFQFIESGLNTTLERTVLLKAKETLKFSCVHRIFSIYL